MITYFTTAKDFIGNTETAQLNAIRSWQCSVKGSEVIIFGKAHGLDKLADDPGILLHPAILTSQEGTPRIDNMFMKAQEIASNRICCFINADIIITREFARAVMEIHQLVQTGYLIVGQRDDVDLSNPLDFSGEWEAYLKSHTRIHGHRHPPSGSDFFAFPKGQYASGEIPDMLVGRAGWDLWMIFHSRKCSLKVIDLSPTNIVVHQNHDYNHRKNGFVSYDHDPEAWHNLRYVPMGETYPYTLHACNYLYKKGKLHCNYARTNLRRFISYELHLRKDRLPFKILRNILRIPKLIV